VSHRLGALLVCGALLLLAWQLYRQRLSRLATLLLAALALQIALGVSNVLLHLPLAVAVAHNGGGALLVLLLVLINYRLRRPAASAEQSESVPAGWTLSGQPGGQ